MNTPAQISEAYRHTGAAKTNMALPKSFILAIFAGIFIALAGLGSSIASATLSGSAARLVSGCVFPAGLAMVILAGSELFTGNNLIIISVLDKQTTLARMLRSWVIVYIGNLVGSLLVAAAVICGNTLSLFGNALAGAVIDAAAAKVSLSFGSALVRGIMCNFLVCIAVWMAMSAKSAGSKVAALFFPIMLFVISGFEHSVANMYQIPVALMAKCIPEYTAAAGADLSVLTIGNFIIKNLIPVTLGNIIGGGLVAVSMWYLYLKDRKDS